MKREPAELNKAGELVIRFPTSDPLAVGFVWDHSPSQAVELIGLFAAWLTEPGGRGTFTVSRSSVEPDSCWECGS